MKSYRPHKRKMVEMIRKQDECKGVSVKKSANGSGFGNQKATESMRVAHLESQIQLQVSPAKIKLQLFPINEQTRLGLEKDGYNPFLELTLSHRKRISSVVRHLNTKWGNSSVAKGELMLFPYNTKLEQVASCRRWTLNDSAFSAWEVYVDVGSPSLFRLRYGWYSNNQQEKFDIPPKSILLEAHTDSEGKKRSCSRVLQIPSHGEGKMDESCETIKKQIDMNEALPSAMNTPKALHAPTGFMDAEVTNNVFPVHSIVPWDDSLTNLSIGGLLSEISKQGKINGSYPNFVNKSGMQPIELISDISMGDLLSEASLLGKMKNSSMKPEKESSLQPIVLASSDISIGGLLSEASLLSKKKLDTVMTRAGHAKIQSQWNDNFTTLSIGGLLSEASLHAKACDNQNLEEGEAGLQPNAPLSNSFDSRTLDRPAAHSQMPKPSSNDPNLSILDAEETCHAFPIRKLQPSRPASNTRARSSRCSNDTRPNQFQFPKVAKKNNETISPKDSSCPEQKTNPFASFSSSQ